MAFSFNNFQQRPYGDLFNLKCTRFCLPPLTIIRYFSVPHINYEVLKLNIVIKYSLPATRVRKIWVDRFKIYQQQVFHETVTHWSFVSLMIQCRQMLMGRKFNLASRKNCTECYTY